MEYQYGMPDLRHSITGRPLFPQIQSPQDLLSTHRPHDMLIFTSDSAAAAGNAFENGGAGRWPRQETLNLLEIRSRLDPKFKEANQKGPLWDEVSRIMCEEHGYQRSSKKCREKFENLYKYYKKTKEGKAGRQDGKHYRFFRQLEALYGTTEANISSVSISEAAAAHHTFPNKTAAGDPTPKASDTSLSLSNYSDADTSSSDDSDDMKKSGWKVKIRDFIDAQMKKVMEKQEAWMEKMMRTIEEKERERAMREEEWRKHDAARIEREHRFWASERAWIEARDAALMNALHKLTGKESHNEDWPECEINKLIQLTTAMEGKFDEEMVWEEIAAKMGCFGHERSAAACKEKWESIHNYVSKKRKDNNNNNYQSHIYCEQGLNNDHGSSSGISESCFRYFMGDAY
ncbi:hypothetical protein SASPL_102179 [Salvia splendens]|uniref:Myb-like domain-containing protein n=2 Tax=Salvia splendens TaxID=180675 RepID=A0A8X9ABX0_SALSN|nr:hypothetical protein SASPL_102179 [Salvia splendens]